MDASATSITVTEKYLNNLNKRLLQLLKKPGGKRIKPRLQSLSDLVQGRIALRKPVPKPSPKAEHSLMFDTLKLSEEENEAIKDWLKRVLDDIKRHRAESHQEGLDPSLSLNYQEETEGVSGTVLDAANLTEQEYDLVKERMREMMVEVKKQRGESTQKAQQVSFHELQQQIEQEVQEEVEKHLQEHIQQEIEREISQEFIPEAKEEFAPVLPEVTDEERELTFPVVCKKVDRGEALVLFDKIKLTEREQQMLQAFEGHLKQMKGLKQQQVFDLQHLTSRSIREFEMIFKTYQPQGYLNVELHNIYKRLLTLRSRFSILLR